MAACPICGLRCVYRMNMDSIECPEHGEMTGLWIMQNKGQSPAHLVIELQAERNLRRSRCLHGALRYAIMHSNPLRVPELRDLSGLDLRQFEYYG